MLVAVVSDSLANDETGITDRRRDRKHAEVARRKITKCVEIKDLAVGPKKRVLGVVARGRGSDNHSGCVSTTTTPGDAVGLACSSPKCSQIGDGIGYLRISSGKRDESEEYCSPTDFVFRFHREMNARRAWV